MPLVRSKKAKISLERAERIAQDITQEINVKTNWCKRCLVVGSIRRRKSEVNDIDILVEPASGGIIRIVQWVKDSKNGAGLLKMGSTTIQFVYQDAQVDLYFATPETWITLLVIRTGSAEHNIKLCQKAKSMGLVLHADGRGIYTKEGSKLKTDSEEEFFNQLGLTYLKPEERD